MKRIEMLVMATHNSGKLREFRRVLEPLGFEVKAVRDVVPGITEPEETGTTFAENALLKAEYYAQKTGLPVLADDSGLVVDALDGRPGVYSARYAGMPSDDEANNRKLVQELTGMPEEKRTARYMCVLVLAVPGCEPVVCEGACEGLIHDEPAGNGGFGYDPYFYVPAKGKTMAAMSLDEKNEISHRGKALRHMAKRLQELAALSV